MAQAYPFTIAARLQRLISDFLRGILGDLIKYKQDEFMTQPPLEK